MSVNGFPASARVKTSAAFQHIYKSNYRGQSDLHRFNLQCTAGAAKLGVTVSKKVSKSAVVRNAIKRHTREYFRLHQSTLPNIELIVTAKPECGHATAKQQRTSLQQLWQAIAKWHRWYQHQQK